MLLTGQPLHAFDLDRVAGGALVVRRAPRRRDDDDARRPGAHARPRRRRDRRRRRADVDRRRHGRRALRGRATTTTRVLHGGRDLERRRTSTARRRSWRCAARPRARFEKGLPPEQALEAQAVATQLMVELTRRDARARDDRRRRRRAPSPPSIRLRDARVDGLLGAPVPRERSAEILSALGFGVEPTPTTASTSPSRTGAAATSRARPT